MSQSSNADATKIIGAIISAVVTGLAGLAAGATGIVGKVLAGALALSGSIGAPVCFLIYRRYLGGLAAGSRHKGSPDRLAYDRLRESLSGGNLAVRTYNQWLGRALDAVDRFFGDAGKADQSLFPHFLGLKTPASTWTASAFDRCVLIALVYPIVTIFVIWVISGHVGPAETALDLSRDPPLWQRLLSLFCLSLGIFILVRTLGKMTTLPFVARLLSALSSLCFIGVGLLAIQSSVTTYVLSALGCAIIFSSVRSVGGGVAIVTGAVLFLVGFGIGSIAIPGSYGANIGIVVTVILVSLLFWFNERAKIRQRDWLFILLSLAAATFICLVGARYLSTESDWPLVGPPLLFLGWLTLLNAPFNWLSLGLTRALLRRGLELGGCWPFILAIVDAALAIVMVGMLLLTMVVGVQVFDALSTSAGVRPILPL